MPLVVLLLSETRQSTMERTVLNEKPLWKRMFDCWPLYLMLLPAIVYYIVIVTIHPPKCTG